jgi:transcriptional regulator with XRE-family HTH domain
MPDKPLKPRKPEPVERLRQLRLDRDWTNRHLCELIKEQTGISRTEGALRKVLDGDALPNPRTLHAIERFLEGFDGDRKERIA